MKKYGELVVRKKTFKNVKLGFWVDRKSMDTSNA